MVKLICQQKSYIQPFEEKLAREELKTLSGSTPLSSKKNSERGPCFSINSRLSDNELAKRLTYWDYVSGSRKIPCLQVLREATVNVVRNGLPIEQIADIVPFREEVPLPNRRCLRYGTHGIHEYRGKFFPQLVRSLINIAGVSRDGVIADPMCGSGTTVVEGILAGHKSLGADMNPLSAFMARTKCALLSMSPGELTATYETIRAKLLSRGLREDKQKLRYFMTLPISDQTYLRRWFSEQVLLDLDEIVQVIHLCKDGPVKDFLLLALSNILRRVSWQKEDDLRVRKEIRADIEVDPIKEFLEELGRSVRTVLAFLYQNRGTALGSYRIEEADARKIIENWGNYKSRVDVVITSPPYATALPYLDTDRLSLIYIGLLSRPQHRKLDLYMIGNREITEKWRKIYWGRLLAEKRILPQSVAKLIEKIDSKNSGTTIGFRRRNLPALLAKYFFDMREVLIGIGLLLRKGRSAFVVVGNNHTIAGGQRIDIPTADLLSDLADSVGLKPVDQLPMEMLQSRDIFKRNAVVSETILFLERKRYK